MQKRIFFLNGETGLRSNSNYFFRDLRIRKVCCLEFSILELTLF